MIILIAIGVIVYFDMLNPDKFIPQTCEFGDQLECRDMIVYAETEGPPAAKGDISLKFLNNFPKNVTIGNVTFVEYALSVVPINTPNGVMIPSSEIGTVTISSGAIPAGLVQIKGDKVKVRMKISYGRSVEGGGIGPSHTVSGFFVTTVQPR
ncbi:MAG: hypothetical protein V1743_05535 [Nanoarchaeota archaeon]